ncbi:ABC transporter permease [Brachybacterium timonense]|uniref:ABC transporter permease n=1 Tax=Brachybacterium timonense TaxID=2050896 RepID=UPI000D0BD354|nr:ABC transporter permease [Brachybacterium timonense]
MTTAAHDTQTTATTMTDRPSRRPGFRLLGLARAELTLLLRNRMQLIVAITMPVAIPFLLLPLVNRGVPAETLAGAMGLMIVMALLFVVYYNLLSAYVARRQDLVLKRLRTGEASDATVLASTAVPALTIAVTMILLMGAFSTPMLGLPLPTHPLMIVLGVALGAVVLVPLALVTATMTRTVEAAQVTSLPLMAVLLIGSGAVVPLDLMPEWFGRLVRLIPSSAIVELTRTGWLGVDADGAARTTAQVWGSAIAPTAVLLGWLALGLVLVARTFRWEPRG